MSTLLDIVARQPYAAGPDLAAYQIRPRRLDLLARQPLTIGPDVVGYTSFYPNVRATEFVLTASPGAFAETGQAANLAVGLPADVGVFALTGQSTTLAVVMPAAFGSFALTGQDAALSNARIATHFASFNSAANGGWNNITNVYADDGSYSTASPAQNGEASWNLGFAGFTTSEIPPLSTILNVFVEVQWKVDTQASIATLGLRIQNPVGSDISIAETQNTSEPLSDTVDTNFVEPAFHMPTLADLQTSNQLVAVLRALRGNTATSFTASVDYIKLSVLYKPGFQGVEAAGSFALSGQAANFDTKLPMAAGSFTETGQSTTLAVAMPAAFGSFTLSGQAVNMLRGLKFPAAFGSFAFSGQAMTPAVAMPAAFRSFVLTGEAATLVKASKIPAAFGSFALNGQAATLAAGRIFASARGLFALSGQAVNLAQGKGLAAVFGSFALSGQANILRSARFILPAHAVFTLNGQSAALWRGYLVQAAFGAYALSGLANAFQRTVIVQVAQGVFALVGQDAGLTFGAAGPGPIVLSPTGLAIVSGPVHIYGVEEEGDL